MVKFCPLPQEKLKRVLTIEEHAELVLELLKEQNIKSSVRSDDLCPIRNEMILIKLSKTIHELEMKQADPTYTPICAGAHVSTKSKDISPMGPRKKSRGVRLEVHGNVIKKSDYFPGYWLVHFFSEGVNEYYYCVTRALKFICSTTVTTLVGPGMFDNNLTSVPIYVPPHDNEEAIMICLLNDKIHRSEGYKNISVNHIVEIFAPKFAWLTTTKLHDFIKTFRSSFNKKANAAKKKNNKPSPNSVTTSTFDTTTNDEYNHSTSSSSITKNISSKYKYAFIFCTQLQI